MRLSNTGQVYYSEGQAPLLHPDAEADRMVSLLQH